MNVSVVMFTADLRLHDHPPLRAANEADELGSIPDEEDQPRNPKKRMWEEEEGDSQVPSQGDEAHVRDEL